MTLLICQHNTEALTPLSTIFGRCGEPYAIRICLSWTLHGVLVDSQHGRPSHTCLVAADSGSSEQVQPQQGAERGTRRSVHQDYAHCQCISLSAGPKKVQHMEKQARDEERVRCLGLLMCSRLSPFHSQPICHPHQGKTGESPIISSSCEAV